MRSGLVHALALATYVSIPSTVLLVGCSGGADPVNGDVTGASPTSPGDGPDAQDGGTSPVSSDGPHALGTILLGESHIAGQSESLPIVSVTFVPDAAKVSACKETIAGCEVTKLPECTSSCGLGEVCAFDASCRASCQPVPQCDEPCKDDEICALTNASTGEGECRPARSFDAGPVSLSGSAGAITLFPPYVFSPTDKGAPFVGGTAILVKAQGAVDEGFEAFEEKFDATTYIQTKPALDKLALDVVFGKGALPVTWVAGKDLVRVTVGGAAGSATCTTKDESGRFEVPRAVVDRVRGDGFGSDRLTLSVARVRTETRKDKKAKGGPDVQRNAWLELTTTSIESTSFQGCAAGTIACGDTCCSSGKSCVSGACVASACESGPENTLARCSDGCSNDGDAYIDCNDFDCCSVRTDCPPTTSCGKQ